MRDFDILIVGARCSGAALATLLARAGVRVLLLDRQAMPSDHPISTHSINPPGMDVLDEIGVGDAVRAVAPATRILRMSLDGSAVDIELPVDRAVHCPRRKRLDGLLQQAAVRAGAELRDRTRVVSLVRENGRVTGVRAVSGDSERTFTAGLVVGADGRLSTVANLVEAEEYLGYDSPRGMYWGYWNAPDFWKTDPAYRFDAYFSFVRGLPRVIFQTDHDQLLFGCGPLTDEIDDWRSDPRAALEGVLRADPVIGPLVRASSADGHVLGTLRERYYFRRAAGSGWVLVGDAGHHKEVLLGDGISEALLQARSLAAAIGAGTDAALALWWRARDVEALPLYFLGKQIAAPNAPLELQHAVFARIEELPDLKQRFLAVIDRELSPFEAVPALDALRWTLGAALRGRWKILPELLAVIRQGAELGRELRARRRLLAEAERVATAR